MQEVRQLFDLFLDFERGARFHCSDCSAEGCPAHDAEDKEWRHLNFMRASSTSRPTRDSEESEDVSRGVLAGLGRDCPL